MGFKKGNRAAPRYYQDPVTGEKTSYEEMTMWDEGEVVDPWELTALCEGCASYGPTLPLAVLDRVINIPAHGRMEVGRLIRDSVGCPMSGPSHSKVRLEWKRMDAGCAVALEAA